jgi:hypothetical protein
LRRRSVADLYSPFRFLILLSCRALPSFACTGNLLHRGRMRGLRGRRHGNHGRVWSRNRGTLLRETLLRGSRASDAWRWFHNWEAIVYRHARVHAHMRRHLTVGRHGRYAWKAYEPFKCMHIALVDLIGLALLPCAFGLFFGLADVAILPLFSLGRAFLLHDG